MDYLKTYKIEIETLAPVFVGSGETIGKKEYVFHKYNKKVLIPDLYKLYTGLGTHNLLREYEKYLLYDKRDLFAWFKSNNVERKTYEQWMKYQIESGDSIFEDKSKKEIQMFIKDAYGCPYIPGSSLKGAIRTILLSKHLIDNNNLFDDMKKNIISARQSGKNYLKRDIEAISSNTFNTLNRNKKKHDAVNDNLAGIRISDSKPLSTDDLVLCQKIDVSVDGTENNMPIFRECLKTNVKIEFDLTIDTKLYTYDAQHIINSINVFFENYQEVFLKAFKSYKKYPENNIYLGGGSGYVTKTVTYPLFGKSEGIKVASKIIDNTINQKDRNKHKHYKDEFLGASPHMLKCTRYNNILHEMGLCKINIINAI